MLSKSSNNPDPDRLHAELWERVRKQQAEEIPIPGLPSLSEDEQNCLFFARMLIARDEKAVVPEEELEELLEAAEHAKFRWYTFRALMAGILDVRMKDGEPHMTFTNKFLAENPNLPEILKRNLPENT